MSRGGKRPNQTGRPKAKEPYSSITFRVSTSKKEKVKERYGKNLNKMFREWFDSLLP